RAGAGRIRADAGAQGAEIAVGRGRDADAVRVGQVDVAEREMAAGGGRKRILGDRRRLSGGGDGRRVFGALDGDRDGLVGLAAVAVVDLDRVGLGERVVGAEILDRGIVDGEAPVDLARAGAGRIRADAGAQGAEIAV